MSAINAKIENRLTQELMVARVVRLILAEWLVMTDKDPTGPTFAQAFVDKYGSKTPTLAREMFALDSETVIAAIRYWQHCIDTEVRGRVDGLFKQT